MIPKTVIMTGMKYVSVEYSLTAKGVELGKKFVELDFWEKSWKDF